ncbi:MAG: hypothetical protein LBF90_05050, partial [Prevotellaceae bacterium]|nr:hypothetical protein [Prevotellaceae bacterium]
VRWLPRNHETLHNQAQQTVNYINRPENLERMGLGQTTPGGIWYATDFTTKYNAYLTARVTCPELSAERRGSVARRRPFILLCNNP